MRYIMKAASLAAVLTIGLGAVSAFASNDRNRDNNGPNDDFRVYLNRAIDSRGEDPCHAGEVYQGSGAPNTGWARKRNLDAGIELALKAIMRQGPDIPASYVDSNNLIHFEVPSGTQVGNPNRAAWSWNYSIIVGLLPGNPDLLTGYDIELWVDSDATERQQWVKLKLGRVGAATTQTACGTGVEPDLNGLGWKNKGQVIIGDDEGTDHETQNSQNVAFWLSVIDSSRRDQGIQTYTYGPAQFDVILSVKKTSDRGNSGDTRTTLHVVFDVLDPPGTAQPDDVAF
jgi:hypothetical protein